MITGSTGARIFSKVNLHECVKLFAKQLLSECLYSNMNEFTTPAYVKLQMFSVCNVFHTLRASY